MKMYVSRPTQTSPYYMLNKPFAFGIEPERELKEEFKIKYNEDLPTEYYTTNHGEVEVDIPDERAEETAKLMVEFFNLQAELASMFHAKKVKNND